MTIVQLTGVVRKLYTETDGQQITRLEVVVECHPFTGVDVIVHILDTARVNGVEWCAVGEYVGATVRVGNADVTKLGSFGTDETVYIVHLMGRATSGDQSQISLEAYIRDLLKLTPEQAADDIAGDAVSASRFAPVDWDEGMEIEIRVGDQDITGDIQSIEFTAKPNPFAEFIDQLDMKGLDDGEDT